MNRYLAMALMSALNAFDGAATNFILSGGYGTERNPVMRYFYSMGPEQFFLAKVWGVFLWCGLVWVLWPRKTARWAAYATLFSFACVVGYEMVNLPSLIMCSLEGGVCQN